MSVLSRPARQRPRGRGLMRLVAPLLALALVATACGADDGVGDDPAGALQAAVAQLADYDGFELIMHLEADDEALDRALEELDATEREILFGSSATVRTSGDGDNAAIEVVLTAAGQDVVEFRLLPDLDVYARADLAAFADLVDDPELTADLDMFVADAEMFGLGEVAQAIQDGTWIRLTGLRQALAMFDAMAPEEPDVDEEEAERLAEELAAAFSRFLDQDVEVEYVGSEDAGERVRVSTDGAVLGRFLDDVSGIVASSDALSDLGEADLGPGAGDVMPTGTTVHLDVWISGGEISQVAVDLMQMPDEDLGGEVLLVIEVSEFTGTVGAPADATEIDVFEIVGAFFGAAFGPMGDDPFGDDPFGDDAFEDEAFEDDLLGEAEMECITMQELEEIEEFFGEDARQEMEEMIEMGLFELC